MEFHDAYMVAQALVDTIRDRAESTVEMFAENGIEVTHAENFGESGVLTRNAGLVITLADGAEYQVTVVRSR
jgi:hypothetical protein